MTTTAAPAAPPARALDARRRRARRPHPDPAPAARPLRRAAAAPPLALLLQQVPALPRRLAPPLPQRRTHPAQRRHVPRRPRRRRTLHLPPPTSSNTATRSRSTSSTTPTATTGPASSPPNAAKRGVRWDAELDEPRAFTIGLEAVTLALRRARAAARPGRRRPTRTDLRARARPGVDDPGLPRPRNPPTRRRTAASRSRRSSTTRSRARLHSQAKADHDPQAGLYLAGRWLTGDPAEHFCFAQIGQARRPPQDHDHRASSPPAAPPAQLRATLARIAQAASQIAALHDRYGPDEPWGFADPSGWKCSPRYCAHHARCPGGGGL